LTYLCQHCLWRWKLLCLTDISLKVKQVICQRSCLTSASFLSELSNYRQGKIQLNTTHWTPISNVIFADPQREGYKFHFLLGSVDKLSAGTNFNFPASPFNHFPGICKNLADTWPAATRGRKREDPGNEVANKRCNVQNSGCACALEISAYFFAILCKTKTCNDQVLHSLRNMSDDG